ncbi:molybdopterin oxidoreductase family protein [Marivibrio halodurans]|uniref:Molybdopterin oxidoreductase family protein n=1 Tax=Marivibrio halodurans TaxID=2039722 RepID=A0A8J7SN20_9PROT|nr:molybdopterin oxidoreductase family protein [Marivibrio halodurans]MBP5857748.1 molybdopterin oxidoreductase family protein [Marivibrio halodurans]
MAFQEPDVPLTRPAADEIRKTTCYMCACRCGIRVHMKDGAIRYIDGNPDHPVNRGVLCAKGSAGLMQHLSPARLTKPLKRVGPRGAGEFEEIEWEEALRLATDWLGDVRTRDPKRLAFFTGRDQSQSLTGWWAAKFGTHNFAAHGGFCSVNMAAAGLYSIGSSFWEFGEPDWERTKLFLLFGVAEDHESNPIKLGLGKLKTRGAKVISINPVRTGYSAIADEWVGVRPGTDGLFAGALIRELLRADRIDHAWLAAMTDAAFLVIRDPGAADDGLYARDEEGRELVWDGARGACAPSDDPDARPVLAGERALPDGRRAVPAFQLVAERFLEPGFAPEEAAAKTGVPAATIRRIARELAEAAFDDSADLDVAWTDWAGRRHDKMTGRPVAMHAMRGISAHSNGFHTCRTLHLLQMMLGAIDRPGSSRHKPPFPRPCPPGPKPAGPAAGPNEALSGMPLGFPTGPEDLLVEEDGTPLRIDKAYSWEYPIAAHGLMHMVLHNAWAGDPYEVDVLFMYMANMGWNSAMNVPATLKYLTDKKEDGSYRIPRIIYSDAYYSETVAYADLVLPDTTYLERWDCISLLDRPISGAEGPGDSIRWPVVEPDRDVRPFQDVLLQLGARLRLPGFVDEAGNPAYPGGYPDYIVNHERAPGIGPLAGWRGETGADHGRGAVNPDQLKRYIENGGFWREHFPDDQLYFKHANKAYLENAHAKGWIPSSDRIVLRLYSEVMQKFRLAAQGHGPNQPPEKDRARVARYFDPIPFWYPPFEGTSEEAGQSAADFPLSAITQRPMHMYHSWGSQNAWLRQITARNRLYLHPETATAIGARDDDWVWITSPIARVKAQIKTMHGVEKGTVWTWNAIGKRRGAWGLDEGAPETEKGFLLNHLINDLLPVRDGGLSYANADPVTGQAAWYDLRVRVEKCAPHEAGTTEPMFERLEAPPPTGGRPTVLRAVGRNDGVAQTTPARQADWIGQRAVHAAAGTGIAAMGGGRRIDEALPTEGADEEETRR